MESLMGTKCPPDTKVEKKYIDLVQWECSVNHC